MSVITKKGDIVLTQSQYDTLKTNNQLESGYSYYITDAPIEADSLAGVTASSSELNILDGATLTTTELNYLDGVTSNVQTQLNSKATTATTLSGYGITDAKIVSGIITLGSNTITPLTASSTLDATKLSGTASVNTTGNAATATTADTASALANTVDVGSATQPVYFVDGLPIVTGYSVATSVPSGALFTDTTYSNATTSVAGLMSASDKVKLNGIETNAEVNIIEAVKVNGTALTISSKTVDITVPTATSGLTNDSGFVSSLNGLGVTATAAELNVLDGITASTAELNYTDGVTSNIQTQLTNLGNNKLSLSGGTMSGNLNMGSNYINNLPDATANQQPATYKQLNDAIAGLGTVFDLKGSVATASGLPTTGNAIGDVYYVEDESVGYIWIENSASVEYWEPLGETIDLSGYLTKADLLQSTGSVTDNTMSQNAITQALSFKAPLASPNLTGTPVAPTAEAGTNTTQIATTAFVTSAINSGAILSISGTTPISATTTSGAVTIVHATSGVTAGTYKSVTVNVYGHVTAGTNPTSLSGYGITDAKIASGVITLGSNTITPLTSSSTLDATKISGTASIDTTGNADTATTATKLGTATVGSATQPVYLEAGTATAIGHTIATDVPSGAVFTDTTYTGTTPIVISGTVVSHATSGVTASTYRSVTVNAYGHVTAGTNPTTLSGYGITDAKIASGVITLGSNTITPLTADSTLSAAKLSGTIPSTVLAVTASTGTSNTQIATTAFVQTAIGSISTTTRGSFSLAANATTATITNPTGVKQALVVQVYDSNYKNCWIETTVSASSITLTFTASTSARTFYYAIS